VTVHVLEEIGGLFESDKPPHLRVHDVIAIVVQHEVLIRQSLEAFDLSLQDQEEDDHSISDAEIPIEEGSRLQTSLRIAPARSNGSLSLDISRSHPVSMDRDQIQRWHGYLSSLGDVTWEARCADADRTFACVDELLDHENDSARRIRAVCAEVRTQGAGYLRVIIGSEFWFTYPGVLIRGRLPRPAGEVAQQELRARAKATRPSDHVLRAWYTPVFVAVAWALMALTGRTVTGAEAPLVIKFHGASPMTNPDEEMKKRAINLAIVVAFLGAPYVATWLAQRFLLPSKEFLWGQEVKHRTFRQFLFYAIILPQVLIPLIKGLL